MTITLERLLQHDDLGLRLLIGPAERGPEGVRIQWAHSIELPDPRRFLRGGEMVMLTGVRLPRRRTEQEAYVDRLVEAGVAVLGFGTGVQFASVPEAVVARCRQLDLPLVEIPLRTPFMAVSQEIAKDASAQLAAPLHELIDLQQILGRAAVRGGIPELVRRAHRFAGALAVLDADGIIASAAPAWFVAQVTAFVQEGRGASAAGTTILAPDQDAGCALIEMHVLTGRRSPRGFLAIGPRREPRPTDRLLINQIVSLVTLCWGPKQLPVDDRLESVALGALLRRVPADPEILDLAAIAGFAADATAVLICLPCVDGAKRPVHGDLVAAGVGHLCRSSDAETLVLVRADDVDAAIGRIRDSTEAARSAGPIGVSSALPLGDVAGGVEPARRAAASAARRGLPVVHAADVTLETLMAEPAFRGLVRDRTAPILAALDDQTGSRDGDLARAVEVFLRHNGKWVPAAAELGIHRHTLHSRIALARELTGVDLDDAHTRALLMLAWSVRRHPAS